MPRSRRLAPRSPPRTSNLGGIETRIHLFTYALSRLPPRQLPLLAIYAYFIVYACEKQWIDREALGKAGAAVVGVLSMVTGLLLSYSFSNAVSKWEQGKKVWVDVRTTIRDGVRAISIQTPPPVPTSPSATTSSADDLADLSEDGAEDDRSDTIDVKPVDRPRSGAQKGSTPLSVSKSSIRNSTTPLRRHDSPEGLTPAQEKVFELTGLLVGFAFALQHHLHNSRPLPEPPLCDLLPPAYLSSLKRTEARVRFADEHPSETGASTPVPPSPTTDPFRPGLKRRGTGPTTRAQRKAAATEDAWDLSTLSSATSVLSKVASTDDDKILRQQLSQLNIPRTPSPNLSETSYEYGFRTPSSPPRSMSSGLDTTTPRPKSNLTAPNPPNLPLALLRLMEAYIIGLALIPPEKGGWTEPKRDRVLGEVKALDHQLGEAERLSSNPPPLPLSLHLAHLLLIYLAALPCSLLVVVSGTSVVIITMIAGWCLLGLEALVGEVGGVYGISENHHPLQEFAHQILIESLEIFPSFLRYYRSRLVSRLGEDDLEVFDLDRRFKRVAEVDEWMPNFAC